MAAIFSAFKVRTFSESSSRCPSFCRSSVLSRARERGRCCDADKGSIWLWSLSFLSAASAFLLLSSVNSVNTFPTSASTSSSPLRTPEALFSSSAHTGTAAASRPISPPKSDTSFSNPPTFALASSAAAQPNLSSRQRDAICFSFCAFSRSLTMTSSCVLGCNLSWKLAYSTSLILCMQHPHTCFLAAFFRSILNKLALALHSSALPRHAA
mmetsp:Transcript_7160/g.13325  ORF Transcript_7160/g.13325 Transcript_7160/m.13325 type:complete len:211 (+) Transcript_7160:1243-1875(+)